MHSPKKQAEARHGLFQNRTIGGVADADRSFAARAEGNAGRQSDPGFEQQAFTEIERIGRTRYLRKQVERAVGFGHCDARHPCESLKAMVAILFQPHQHFRYRALALQQSGFTGALCKAGRVRDDEFVELGRLRN